MSELSISKTQWDACLEIGKQSIAESSALEVLRDEFGAAMLSEFKRELEEHDQNVKPSADAVCATFRALLVNKAGTQQNEATKRFMDRADRDMSRVLTAERVNEKCGSRPVKIGNRKATLNDVLSVGAYARFSKLFQAKKSWDDGEKGHVAVELIAEKLKGTVKGDLLTESQATQISGTISATNEKRTCFERVEGLVLDLAVALDGQYKKDDKTRMDSKENDKIKKMITSIFEANEPVETLKRKKKNVGTAEYLK